MLQGLDVCAVPCCAALCVVLCAVCCFRAFLSCSSWWPTQQQTWCTMQLKGAYVLYASGSSWGCQGRGGLVSHLLQPPLSALGKTCTVGSSCGMRLQLLPAVQPHASNGLLQQEWLRYSMSQHSTPAPRHCTAQHLCRMRPSLLMPSLPANLPCSCTFSDEAGGPGTWPPCLFKEPV
jgi:hypothetical protein